MDIPVVITIKLCNRTYRIKVDPHDEATVRNTLQGISHKIAILKKDFPGRDDHDYMAMTLLDHITSSKETKPISNVDSIEIAKQLSVINNLLDE